MTVSINGSGGITFPDGSVNTTRSVSTAGDTMTGALTVAASISIKKSDAIAEGGQLNLQSHTGAEDFFIDRFSGHTRYYLSASNTDQIFTTNSIDRLRIYSTGPVTIPYQPVFSATTAANTFTPGSVTYVYETAIINRGGYYNTSNGRFTAPVPGVYYFWHIASARPTTTGTYEVKLYKNGEVNELARSFSSGAGYGHSAFACCHVTLSAGDYVTAGFYNGPAVAFSGQADIGTPIGVVTGWGGYLIG